MSAIPITVRLPPELYLKVIEMAQAERRSMNNLIVRLLEECLKE